MVKTTKKNVLRNTKFLLICLLLIISCQKSDNEYHDEYDYRDAYEGDYLYCINHHVWTLSGVDYDTNYQVNGFVKKVGQIYDSLIEIHYGTDTLLYLEGGKIVAENTAYKICKDNSLKYPGGSVPSHSFAGGKFYNYDTLILSVGWQLLGGSSNWTIKGCKQYHIINP
jgi:hypothetical protein